MLTRWKIMDKLRGCKGQRQELRLRQRLSVRILSGMLAVLICLLNVSSVGAYLANDDSLAKVEYWCQGTDPWAGEPANGKNGGSIAMNCCSGYAMTYALVKMGIFDPKKGDNAGTFFKKMREKGIYEDSGSYNWYCNYSRVNEIWSGITYERSYEGTGSWDSVKSWFKKKYNEGYYLIPCITSENTNGHMVFIDGFTSDGKTSFGDSAYLGLTMEDAHKSANVAYVEMLKYTKPCNEQPSIYDDTALRQGAENDLTKSEVEMANSVISEWELTGMPEKSKIMEKAQAAMLAQMRDDGTGNGLNTAEIQNLKGIKESKDFNAITPVKALSIGVSLIGLVLFVYAMVLMLGYFVDKFNTFLDFSLVNAMTLGKIRVLSKEEIAMLSKEDADKKGYVTTTKFFIILGIIVLIAGFMGSGLLVRYVMMLVGHILK